MDEFLECFYLGKKMNFKKASIDECLNSRKLYWIKIDKNFEGLHDILTSKLEIDPVVAQSLTAEETRPRSYLKDEGALVILRGINLNPGADPEDMVAIRIWIDKNKIISVQNRKIMAVEDVKKSLTNNSGPTSPGEFITEICQNLSLRMSEPLLAIDDRIDELEENLEETESHQAKTEISSLRRKIITIRRYLYPQREALINLASLKAIWLLENEKMKIREVADRITRYIEDLDSGKDRTSVIRDELDLTAKEHMNKIMYVFSIITVVFLPLSLITGLLGINVGGIPGAENKLGFYFVCFFLVIILGLQLWILKKMKWL